MIYNQLQKARLTSPVGRFSAGLVLLFLAAAVLWLNEGAMDVAKITRTSIALTADKVEATANRRLVSITGRLTTADELGDPQYLKPGHYLKLVRKVRVFSRGGWKADPKQGKSWQSPSAQIGAYTIDPQMIELPAPEALKLAPEMLAARGARLDGKYYLFVGGGSLKKPRPGDLRVSYAAVASSLEVTAFGKKQDDMLSPYVTVEYKFYKVFKGNRDQALAKLPAQHTFRLWFLRLIGVLLMWLGFSLFSLPSESLGRRWKQFSQPVLTLGLTAAVSLLIILLSIYSISLLTVCVLALAGYFAYLYFKGRK